MRIWSPGTAAYLATDFRSGDARYRFDHHNGRDPDRAILYGAETLLCCVAEKYGSIGALEPASDRFAVITVTDEIRLLDLRAGAAQQAGTLAGIGSFADHAFSQAWSRYYYENLPQAEGIIYHGAHNASEAIALYERAATKISLARELALSDLRMHYALVEACDLCNILFVH